MSAKPPLRARIRRLRARQKTFLTRYKSYNARVQTSIEDLLIPRQDFGFTPMGAKLLRQAASNVHNPPDFAPVLTSDNIDQEEENLERWEAWLQWKRGDLQGMESVLDAFTSGDFIRICKEGGTGNTITLSKFNIVNQKLRELGFPEWTLEAQMEALLQAGGITKDEHTNGPHLPFENRLERLYGRWTDFNNRREEFVNRATKTFENYDELSGQDHYKWIIETLLKWKPKAGKNITSDTIEVQENRLRDGEARLEKLWALFWYGEYLYEADIAGKPELKLEAFQFAREAGFHDIEEQYLESYQRFLAIKAAKGQHAFRLQPSKINLSETHRTDLLFNMRQTAFHDVVTNQTERVKSTNLGKRLAAVPVRKLKYNERDIMKQYKALKGKGDFYNNCQRGRLPVWSFGSKKQVAEEVQPFLRSPPDFLLDMAVGAATHGKLSFEARSRRLHTRQTAHTTRVRLYQERFAAVLEALPAVPGVNWANLHEVAKHEISQGDPLWFETTEENVDFLEWDLTISEAALEKKKTKLGRLEKQCKVQHLFSEGPKRYLEGYAILKELGAPAFYIRNVIKEFHDNVRSGDLMNLESQMASVSTWNQPFHQRARRHPPFDHLNNRKQTTNKGKDAVYRRNQRNQLSGSLSIRASNRGKALAVIPVGVLKYKEGDIFTEWNWYPGWKKERLKTWYPMEDWPYDKKYQPVLKSPLKPRSIRLPFGFGTHTHLSFEARRKRIHARRKSYQTRFRLYHQRMSTFIQQCASLPCIKNGLERRRLDSSDRLRRQSPVERFDDCLRSLIASDCLLEVSRDNIDVVEWLLEEMETELNERKAGAVHMEMMGNVLLIFEDGPKRYLEGYAKMEEAGVHPLYVQMLIKSFHERVASVLGSLKQNYTVTVSWNVGMSLLDGSDDNTSDCSDG
ncbi:hypothetical protein BJ508DRAFT_379613 [Ascobolus immersus RN42]|uniref:Uncharacterized protein n=1 Tax=Ascobolus immersus RN42 TaxID=1160509 RepID=A0A3N4HR03_ASCIM|nr:hypothetical protein BJ508DRAFT_379613 [Ascobolus immersus RN42]